MRRPTPMAMQVRGGSNTNNNEEEVVDMDEVEYPGLRAVEANIIGTLVDKHGQTVGLVNDNPTNLPLVALPSTEELGRVHMYGPGAR